MNKKLIRWNLVFQYGYVLTNIFNSFILLPLYLKNIDPATLGIWLATGSILTWMTLTDPGVGDVLQQRIAEHRGKGLEQEVGKTIGSGFIASAILLVISITAGLIFFFFLDLIIGKDISSYQDLELALIISIIATGLSLFSFSMSGINQGLHNAAHVAICSLAANVFFLVVNIVFLYLGYGVVSIAIANLARALFINIYNIVAMRGLLRRDRLNVSYDFPHFKKFIRIFSVTSTARIVGGFASSIDLMILARFIPASMITMFEINKRPIKMTQSLVGRHSVALMPAISHAKGGDNKKGIIELINRQFKFYSYATLFISLLFWLTYQDLISVWTGSDQYAGDTVLYMLIAIFFFALIGYFMANMGYALGDIRRNSQVSIIRGTITILLLFIVGSQFGIIGILCVSLFSSLVDFFYFTYRLHYLGYLQPSLLRNTLALWSVVVPAGIVCGWLCKWFFDSFMPPDMQLSKMLLTAIVFSAAFLGIVFLADEHWRNKLKSIGNRLLLSPVFRRP